MRILSEEEIAALLMDERQENAKLRAEIDKRKEDERVLAAEVERLEREVACLRDGVPFVSVTGGGLVAKFSDRPLFEWDY